MFQGIVIAAIAVLVGLDQLTKWLVLAYVQGKPEGITFIPGVMDFEFYGNEGAAMGIFEGERFFLVALTGLVIIAFLAVTLFGKFRRYTLFNISATLIIAGGIGNLIDRLVHGFVVDFLKTTFMSFPIFNVADCFVVVGSVLLLVFFLFFYEEKAPVEAANGNETDSSPRS